MNPNFDTVDTDTADLVVTDNEGNEGEDRVTRIQKTLNKAKANKRERSRPISLIVLPISQIVIAIILAILSLTCSDYKPFGPGEYRINVCRGPLAASHYLSLIAILAAVFGLLSWWRIQYRSLSMGYLVCNILAFMFATINCVYFLGNMNRVNGQAVWVTAFSFALGLICGTSAFLSCHLWSKDGCCQLGGGTTIVYMEEN